MLFDLLILLCSNDFLFWFYGVVEPSAGVDAEGIEVARECLVEAFRINSSSVTGEPDSLIDIFKSFDANKQCGVSRSDCMKASSSSLSGQNASDDKSHPEASESMVNSYFPFVFFTIVMLIHLCYILII